MARLERGWKKDEFSAPRAIWKTALDQKCKIIYLYLVDQLDEGGDPSHAEIARACSCSEKTSERVTKTLHDLGLIERIKRPIPGKKANNTNLYIIHHPEQVEGLPWLEDRPNTKKKKQKVQTESRQGTDSESVGVQTESRQGTDSESVGVQTESRQGTDSESGNSQSVCPSVRQSVDQIPTPKEIIQDYFKKAFGRGLNEIQMDELMSFGLSVDQLKKQIRKVSLYVDIKKSPFAAVIRAVAAAAQGKEWEWNEQAGKNKPQRKPAKPRGSGRGKEDSFPRAIREAMEREENGEQTESEPVDPETEARLWAKWNRMNQRLKARGGTNEN